MSWLRKMDGVAKVVEDAVVVLAVWPMKEWYVFSHEAGSKDQGACR